MASMSLFQSGREGSNPLSRSMGFNKLCPIQRAIQQTSNLTKKIIYLGGLIFRHYLNFSIGKYKVNNESYYGKALENNCGFRRSY